MHVRIGGYQPFSRQGSTFSTSISISVSSGVMFSTLRTGRISNPFDTSR